MAVIPEERGGPVREEWEGRDWEKSKRGRRGGRGLGGNRESEKERNGEREKKLERRRGREGWREGGREGERGRREGRREGGREGRREGGRGGRLSALHLMSVSLHLCRFWNATQNVRCVCARARGEGD
jgi:hypothetical protein